MNPARLLFAATVACLGLAGAPALAAGPAPTPVQAPSDEGAVAAIVSAVEARYAKVETISAAFTQTKTDAFGKVVQDGALVLARPARMRWHFTTGEERLMGSDGKVLWVWSKADDFYSEYDVPADAAKTSENFLTSLDSLDEQFTVTLVSQDGGPTLDLVPRKKGQIARMRLELSDDLTVERVVFTDVYDNVTELAFRDVKLNPNVDPALFAPPRPKTTED